jgi:hypothetical protein
MNARDDQPLPANAAPAGFDILKLEIEILCALCRAASTGRPTDLSLLDTAQGILSRYRFRNIEHQSLFDALCELRPALGSDSLSRAANHLKEHLLQRLTLRGFPEIDLNAYLAPQSVTTSEIIERLKTLAQILPA